MYNEIVLEHFQNPRNVGRIDNANGIGVVGSESCGDTMKVFLLVEDGIITDIKYKTYGCCAAIASSSIATELVKGKTIEEAKKLTKADIVKALGGLPDKKIHCSLLAVDGIREAVNAYEENQVKND